MKILFHSRDMKNICWERLWKNLMTNSSNIKTFRHNVELSRGVIKGESSKGSSEGENIKGELFRLQCCQWGMSRQLLQRGVVMVES